MPLCPRTEMGTPVTQLKETHQRLFPPPLVLAGPTAVGKATLISRLLAEFRESMALPVCHTLRAPRQGEQHGVHFWFAGREEIQGQCSGVNAC